MLKTYVKPMVEVEKNWFEGFMTTESDGFNDNPDANSAEFDEAEAASIPDAVNTNLWDE